MKPIGPPEFVFVCGFVVGAAIRGWFGRRHKREELKDQHTTPLEWSLLAAAGVGMQVLPLIFLFTRWLDFADYESPAWTVWVGAGVFAASNWLLWRSHADLGRNWSATIQIRQDHSLVTHGVYAWIRHPLYAAHWLWALAQLLLLHNWLAGPAFMTTFLLLYRLRAPREEGMLRKHFGKAYEDYARRTGRLFPRCFRETQP